MIEVEHVSFVYQSGKLALDDVSMRLPRERVVAILGESGSGKTTLLRCVGRFLRPTRGRILLDGRELGEVPEPELRRAVGIVFQELHLFPHLTVLENLTLAPIWALRKRRSQAVEAARAMLERLGIAELEPRYPAQISGGQAQRAAIARSLMLRPEYLLLDEPTSALDVETTQDFAAWLRELATDTTIVVVTHDVPFACEVATAGVRMAEGKIVAEGAVEGLMRASP